jgi:hypothetical protein
LNSTTVSVAPGRYRHYKGNDYEVVGMARHSETHEMMVVYRPLYGAQAARGAQEALWVRPAAMFAEDVVIDGKTLPRFARIE